MNVQYVYVEYNPAHALNQFDLGGRKLVHTIELVKFVVNPDASLP
jgi:hypothetical protein